MIITDKSYIADRLKHLKDVVPPRATSMPEGILVKGNQLIADSFDIGISTEIETDNTDEFLLPLRAIDFIQSLPAGEVRIKGTDKSVTVECAAGKSRFTTAPAADFMRLNPFRIDAKGENKLGAEAFCVAVGRVIYACDLRGRNDVAKGVYFDGDGTTLNIVAMDGYRLAITSIPYADEIHCIIPHRAVSKLLSLRLTGQISLSYGKDRAVFSCGGYTISVKRICKDYINYRALFDVAPVVTVKVRADELSDAAKRAMICSTGYKSHVVLRRDNNAPDVLTVTSLSPTADYTAEVGITGANDTEILFGANPTYLIDSLKAGGDGEAEIAYVSSTAVMRICCDQTTALIMPVRIRE